MNRVCDLCNERPAAVKCQIKGVRRYPCNHCYTKFNLERQVTEDSALAYTIDDQERMEVDKAIKLLGTIAAQSLDAAIKKRDEALRPLLEQIQAVNENYADKVETIRSASTKAQQILQTVQIEGTVIDLDEEPLHAALATLKSTQRFSAERVLAAFSLKGYFPEQTIPVLKEQASEYLGQLNILKTEETLWSLLDIYKHMEKVEEYPTAFNMLGRCKWLAGEYGEAFKHYAKARECLTGVPTPEFIDSLLGLGLAALQRKELEEAKQYLTLASKKLKSTNYKDSGRANTVAHALGLVHSAKNQRKTALKYLEHAYEKQLELTGEKDPNTLRFLESLMLVRSENLSKAVDCLNAVQDILKFKQNKFGDGHPETCSAKQVIGKMYYYQRAFKKALPYFYEAAAAQITAFGPQAAAHSQEYIDLIHSKGTK